MLLSAPSVIGPRKVAWVLELLMRAPPPPIVGALSVSGYGSVRGTLTSEYRPRVDDDAAGARAERSAPTVGSPALLALSVPATMVVPPA